MSFLLTLLMGLSIFLASIWYMIEKTTKLVTTTVTNVVTKVIPEALKGTHTSCTYNIDRDHPERSYYKESTVKNGEMYSIKLRGKEAIEAAEKHQQKREAKREARREERHEKQIERQQKRLDQIKDRQKKASEKSSDAKISTSGGSLEISLGDNEK